MNEELVRRLIREAGADAYAIHDNTEALMRFAALVAAEVCEQCADLCYDSADCEEAARRITRLPTKAVVSGFGVAQPDGAKPLGSEPIQFHKKGEAP